MSDKRNYLVTVIAYSTLNDKGEVTSTVYRTTPMFSSVEKMAGHTAAMQIPPTTGSATRTTMTTFRWDRTHNDSEIIDAAIASGVFDEQSCNVLKGKMVQPDERDIALAAAKQENAETKRVLEETLARLRTLETKPAEVPVPEGKPAKAAGQK